MKILLAHGERLLFILLANQDLPILHEKLESFKQNFYLFFEDLIDKIVEDPAKFSSIERLVTAVFRT